MIAKVREKISFYGHILPGITIISLIGIASFTKHVAIGNNVIDFGLRLFLTVWFVRIYRALATEEKLGLDKLTSDEQQNDTLIFLYGIIFGVFSGFLTSWIINHYFHLFDLIRLLLSVCNAFLISIPILKSLDQIENYSS